MEIHIALSLALLGSLVLAGVLLCWADRVVGARLLVGFLIGVSIWIVGNELPGWAGPAWQRPALMLLATAAITSAIFFHFTVAFTRTALASRCISSAYAVGGAATLLSVAVLPGTFEPFAGLPFVAMPNAVGWLTSLTWAALAGAGQIVLLFALLRGRGLVRRQVAAVMAASAWGLLCMSGYAVAALRLPFYPWPLLGLPAYPVILVYGILRYSVLVANAWARRALGWTLLVGLAGMILAAMPLLPLADMAGARWLSGAAVAVAFLVLGGPVRRLAERIVYPGGGVSASDMAQWRAALGRGGDAADLAAAASDLLSRRLATAVAVEIGDAATADPAGPSLVCQRHDGAWRADLIGWEAAPPGPRRVAELMGALLAEELPRLERAAAMAEQERERQTQARLAELGALAAAVAHDVRNPLNIIGMAVATAEPEMRREVSMQVRRIARLAEDLLDYAKPWRIEPQRFDLAAQLRGAHPAAMFGPGLDDALYVLADPRRIGQAVANLVDNARSVAGRIGLDADRDADRLRLHVCDDGPGVPAALRKRVFEPFVSGRVGGTGLGLAIVARIMAAHGGEVALTGREGWTTCFTLSLPVPP